MTAIEFTAQGYEKMKERIVKTAADMEGRDGDAQWHAYWDLKLCISSWRSCRVWDEANEALTLNPWAGRQTESNKAHERIVPMSESLERLLKDEFNKRGIWI